MNDDLISRQKAIEAVEHITSSMSVCVNTDECHGMKRMQRQAAIELANLPSTQPEIVRCKNCVNWIPGHITEYDDFIQQKCGKYQQMVGHSSDDYCSFAERITDA